RGSITARPVTWSEVDAPAVDVARIRTVDIAHAQPPCTVQALAAEVDVGIADHVVRTVARAGVLDPVSRTIRGHQVDLQVAAIAVADVQVHPGRRRRIAAAAVYRDRAFHHAGAGDRIVT